MASNFDRWEKDPFFSAAEEVQESADRMESTYRTWIHAKKDGSCMWDAEGLRRDLHTALGTAKWQLEEFERAVRSSYVGDSNDDARDRHYDFINAIQDNIIKIENSLKESALSEGKSPLAWVRLDEGECNELALFLSGPPLSENNTVCQSNTEKEQVQETRKGLPPVCGKNLNHSFDWGHLKANREEKSHGHRRTASASADIGAWKIVIAEDGCQLNYLDEPASRPPQKIPSFSGFLNSMESASKFKWTKNGARKWKPTDCHHESDTAPLQSVQLSRGINACYEKSKSCLNSCDECYDKQLYGWYGALQRQLQRSQYQMQYLRPVQAAIWITLLVCLIAKGKPLLVRWIRWRKVIVEEGLPYGEVTGGHMVGFAFLTGAISCFRGFFSLVASTSICPFQIFMCLIMAITLYYCKRSKMAEQVWPNVSHEL